ncbi:MULTISPECIES: YaaL family protein [Lacticaseibacillus]|uniref:YaaL family protein n=2 Tax=Lacticaseibacillus TaxID=2759736 RepID=A0ABW4CGE3_9LACO|nr:MULTISPECIES: YaaL family protein [Lacticaseibacillus]
MFFKAKPAIKENADQALMDAVTDVRGRMAHQRNLLRTFREVDEQTRASLALQEALFDFLYREARVRKVSGAIIQKTAAEQLSAANGR